MRKASWFLIFLILAISCLDQPDCFLLNNDLVGINFRVIGSGKADTVLLRSVVIDERLDVFPPRDTAITSLLLPLNYFTQATNVVFETPGESKSLVFNYDVKAQFVSEDCGPRYVLSDLELLQLGFDSVRVVNASPGRDGGAQNVEIFRCPVTNILAVTLNQLTLPAVTAASTQRSRVASAALNRITVDNVTPLYENTRAATVLLPVSLSASSASFSFDFSTFGGDKPVRDFSITYEPETRVFYRPCGTQTRISNIRIASSATAPFDSLSFARNPTTNTARNFLSDPYETNINVYRCPDTNIVQLAFQRNGLPVNLNVTRITASHLPTIFYADSTTRIAQLPLNPSANSTVFTIETATSTQTLTLNHTWSPMPRALYRRACSDRVIVTNLSAAPGQTGVDVINAAVQFPPVTNVNVQVP